MRKVKFYCSHPGRVGMSAGGFNFLTSKTG